jgi:hypothetical protein
MEDDKTKNMLVEYDVWRKSKQQALVRKAQERIEKEKKLGSLKKKKKSRVAPAPAQELAAKPAVKEQQENEAEGQNPLQQQPKFVHAQQLAVGELTSLLDTLSKKVEQMSLREKRLFDFIGDKVGKSCKSVDDAMKFVDEIQRERDVLQVVNTTAARMIGVAEDTSLKESKAIDSHASGGKATEGVEPFVRQDSVHSQLFMLTATLVWLGGSTCFYHFYNGWPWSHSFYYTVQAGLSIGFGALVEPNDWSKLFTAFNVLFGAAVACTALFFWAEDAIRENERIHTLITESHIFASLQGRAESSKVRYCV